jgi:hypothetical protein
MEFAAWPKTPRLFRDMIVTEKIDGTNAAIVIQEQDLVKYEDGTRIGPDPTPRSALNTSIAAAGHLVGAQSRSRLITPEQDNHGFAKWVFDNAADLVKALGPGRHFGEWWGSGINRGYGLEKGKKMFSLFNVVRYQYLWDPSLTRPDLYDEDGNELLPALDVVPVIYEGPFETEVVKSCVDSLRHTGSLAAPGFDRPEGVVVFHSAANSVFKVTLEGDEKPKGLA